jgi:hypothetical protein
MNWKWRRLPITWSPNGQHQKSLDIFMWGIRENIAYDKNICDLRQSLGTCLVIRVPFECLQGYKLCSHWGIWRHTWKCERIYTSLKSTYSFIFYYEPAPWTLSRKNVVWLSLCHIPNDRAETWRFVKNFTSLVIMPQIERGYEHQTYGVLFWMHCFEINQQ